LFKYISWFKQLEKSEQLNILEVQIVRSPKNSEYYSRHVMTRKKRNIDMEKEGWLSFQQLWIRSRRASRSSSHLYVSPDYSFDNNKDNFHHDFRERTKLQYDTPHRNRKFLNIHIKHLTNKRQFYKINYNDTLASFLLYKHISSNRKFGHLIRKEKNFRLQKLNV